jgi:hypothetical protein
LRWTTASEYVRKSSLLGGVGVEIAGGAGVEVTGSVGEEGAGGSGGEWLI